MAQRRARIWYSLTRGFLSVDLCLTLFFRYTTVTGLGVCRQGPRLRVVLRILNPSTSPRSSPTPDPHLTFGRLTRWNHGLRPHLLTLAAKTRSAHRPPAAQASSPNLRFSFRIPVMSRTENVASINIFTSGAPPEPTQNHSEIDLLTLSPVARTAGQGHSRSPSDPNFLSAPSPIVVRPVSPTSSTEDAPPSPTHSARSSAHFKVTTTTDLRGRNPGDGMSSLQAVQHHARKSSAVSFQTTTEPESSAHGAPPSFATSTRGLMDISDKRERDAYAAPANVAYVSPTGGLADAADDYTADPTPFAFKPCALAALVDPKSLEGLERMGGLEGLCAGLGTGRTNGLSAHSLGQGASVDGGNSGGEGPFAAPLSDRQRVYGTNSLPLRRSKSLLQLVWLALKDKVLVCSSRDRNYLRLIVLIFP